jgi:F-type H+-transporting ATPase subunit gamma
MPALIDLRRRIRAVKSTQQITKAMKMIAASRLRKAQDRVFNARPFAIQTLRVLNSLVSRVDRSQHPLLADTDGRASRGRTLLIVMTADKGLCGSFNTNIIKEAGRFITESVDRQIALGLIGRKGRDFFRRRGFDVLYETVNIFAHLTYEHAQDLGQAARTAFVSGQVDSVYVLYNEFKSVMQQRVVIERVLPIPQLAGSDPAMTPVDYIYEPPAQVIFDRILPTHVDFQIFRAMLESAAAEHAARMTAMDAAAKNSAEVIENLTLYLNKVRQAAITREIIEVVSGAQAL